MRLVNADETLKAMDTQDKFHIDPNNGKLVFGSTNEYVAYLRYGDVINCVRNMPTIDAAPVVLCKDCKHLYGTICAVCGLLPRKPDDFCSYGERKDSK